jgi:hypothetical protein
LSLIRSGLALSSAALLIAGCGGSNNTSVLPNLYAGSWTGTWAGPLANDGGSVALTVAADGSVAGTMSRSGGLSGTLGGIVNNTGKLTATTNYPSSGNFIISGQVVLNQGSLDGSFNYSWLGTLYQGTFTATSQSTTSSGSGT